MPLCRKMHRNVPGFRVGRSTIDQIFTLRQILEKSREYNMDTYHLFIDFRSAYNSVIRTKLYQTMSDLQIPPKITRIVKAIMAKIVCKIKVQNELSKTFETIKGVRQGDGLTCTLFNLALEIAIRKSGAHSEGTILNKSSQLLAFADDIIARSTDELKRIFYSIERVARNMGLEINEEKTKIVISTTSKTKARTRIEF